MFGFGKHYLPDDFFSGACDVHCHLLPGVDDGFPSTEKSLYALKKLEEWGVKKMLLTPHFMKDYPDNNRANIIKEFDLDTDDIFSYPGIALLAPSMTNVRFRNQNGLFFLYPKPWEENYQSVTHKYIIPAESKKDIMNMLNKIGFTRTFIMPSLDNLCKDIVEQYKLRFHRSMK